MRHVLQYDCAVLQRVLEKIIGNIVECHPVVQESGTKQIYCRSFDKTVLIVTVTDERCQLDTNNTQGPLLQHHIDRLRDAIEACVIDWGSCV